MCKNSLKEITRYINIYHKMDNQEINWRKCDVCNVSFTRQRDYNTHIKTAKHIKKTIGIDECKCSYCNYTTIHKSDLNKHIKTVHRDKNQQIEEKLIKVGSSDIPESVLKQYFLLNDGAKTAYYTMMGRKHRIKVLMNRNFKEDEKELIDAKKDFKQSIEFYKNTVEMVENIKKKFPNIIEAIQPTKKEIEDEEYDSDNEEDNKIKLERQVKILEIEDMKDELDELYTQLKDRDFTDLNKHKSKISKLEKEIKQKMNNVYK